MLQWWKIHFYFRRETFSEFGEIQVFIDDFNNLLQNQTYNIDETGPVRKYLKSKNRPQTAILFMDNKHFNFCRNIPPNVTPLIQASAMTVCLEKNIVEI